MTEGRSREEIFEKMMKADEDIADLKAKLNKAKSDLFWHNKPMNAAVFSRWQHDLALLGRKKQRLQFEMGQAKRRERVNA